MSKNYKNIKLLKFPKNSMFPKLQKKLSSVLGLPCSSSSVIDEFWKWLAVWPVFQSNELGQWSHLLRCLHVPITIPSSETKCAPWETSRKCFIIIRTSELPASRNIPENSNTNCTQTGSVYFLITFSHSIISFRGRGASLVENLGPLRHWHSQSN